MAKQPATATNPFANLPLPDYAVKWDADAYRPKTLPAVYEPRIDPAHIFALPDQDDGSELYVVAHRCMQCARVRQTCSRGSPTCKRCAEKELDCNPTEKGWVEVPVPRKKPALRQEVQALRNSLPDAPYYREHSKSVAKSMTVPTATGTSSALRKGMRNSSGQDSVSPAQKGRRGNVGGEKQGGSKRGGRKAPVSLADSDEEGNETTQESSAARPEDSTNLPSSLNARRSSPTPRNTVSTRPLSVTYVTTNKTPNAIQHLPPAQNIATQLDTAGEPSNAAANSSYVPHDSAKVAPVSSGPSPLPTSAASVPATLQDSPEQPRSRSLDIPALPSQAPAVSTPNDAPSGTKQAPIAAVATEITPSRLSIRVPPRVGVLSYGAISAQRAAEQFLGISRPASQVAPLNGLGQPSSLLNSGSASTSSQKPKSTSTPSNAASAPVNASSSSSTLPPPAVQPPAPRTASDPVPPVANSAVDVPVVGTAPAAETQNNPSQRQDDSSCSFRLSAPAWSNSAPPASSTPAQDVIPSDADFDSSSDEPLSTTLKRANGTSQASPPASASASASANGAGERNKRKRVAEPSEDPARKIVPWWTNSPFPWYNAGYQPGMAGPSNGVMPVAIPFISAPMMHSVPQRPPQPVEPFLSPLRPPLPSLQQRAERFAQVQQAQAEPQQVTQPQSPAQEEVYNSEEEVEQYLKRPRRKKSHSRSSSSRATPQEQQQLTFVPKQRILEDSAVVMVEDILFHLPKSRLVQNSEFFARQLAKDRERDKERDESSTDDEERTVDRCPVVKVNGVCAEDFEALLGVCDNLGSFLEKQPPFKTLSAVFCASRTLRFGQIDALATYKLTNMWPGDLHKLSPVRTPFAAETVVLARMYAVPAVLKRAFYELLRSEGFAQQAVISRSTSMSADSSNAGTSITYDGSRLIGKAKLSHADLVRLILAREKLSLAWTLLVGSPPSATTLPCMLQHTTTPNALYSTNTARERCAAATKNSAAIWAEWVLDSGLFEHWMYDPVCGLERLSVLDWENSGYCSSCVMARRQLWSRKREEIWENLDVWLGL